MISARLHGWAMTMCAAGLSLAIHLFVPNEVRTDSGPEGTSLQAWEHQQDFASYTFWILLHEQNKLKLSAHQVGQLKTLAADYAKTHIRDHAAVELAGVDVRSLLKSSHTELSSIEAALRKSEAAVTTERLDRTKAIRTALEVLTLEQLEAWKATIRDPQSGTKLWNGVSRHEPVCDQDRPNDAQQSSPYMGATGHERLVTPAELR